MRRVRNDPDNQGHPTADLLAYWLDELDEGGDAKIEEHLFACDDCGAALQELVRIGDAVRRELRKGNSARW